MTLPPCYRCKRQPCECADGCTIYHGDCREILPLLEAVDCVVTDPPYGLEFMGKDWDGSGVAFQPNTWRAIAAACKPGAPLLAFGGTRTHHRLICAIEDAGWEIRDCLMWLYGSGFPKSLDVSKAIDKAAGAKREVVGKKVTGNARTDDGWAGGQKLIDITAPATEAAKLWDGWGTALKPAYEPICLAMKPLDGTFAENAVKHGVAGLNVDGSRIQTDDQLGGGASRLWSHYRDDKEPSHDRSYEDNGATNFAAKPGPRGGSSSGRWPANVILDEEAGAMLDEQTGQLTSGGTPATRKADKFRNTFGDFKGGKVENGRGGSTGGASRFFYCAKASKADRGYMPAQPATLFDDATPEFRNTHSTVKPQALMRWLLTLVSPPVDGLVLDPFAGSGTTLVAAQQLGLRAVGIELSEEYCEIAAERLRQGVML